MKITEQMTIGEKLRILTDAAKYDVACTSSGNKRSGDGSGMGNCGKRNRFTVQCSFHLIRSAPALIRVI